MYDSVMINTHIYIYIYIFIDHFSYTYMYIFIHKYMHLCIRVFICIHMYIYVYICMCIHIYTYIHKYVWQKKLTRSVFSNISKHDEYTHITPSFLIPTSSHAHKQTLSCSHIDCICSIPPLLC